ncbi:MAG: rhodanese-like domain-containing protein [Planctomycetaceae bacterium]|nr:rhodanese-like domain-containing protein [Planctomycetaceae bacterium]
MVATITAKELHDRVQAGESIDLIDVRTPAEYREVHATIAKNFPLEKFDVGAVLAQHPGSTPLYVICRSGSRGKQACEKLAAAGCTRAVNVEGGTLAWDQAGLPVVRGRKAISLERQVRICAGFMALAGGLLGIFVNPYFAGVSAFVGAGLMFAGITDTCGMAMILARMPWNQTASPSSSAQPTASSSGATKNCSTQSTASCCG